MFSAKNYGLPKDLIEAAKRVHEKQLEEQQKPTSLEQAVKRVDLATKGVIPRKATKPSARDVYKAMGGTKPKRAKKPQTEEVQFTEEELAEAFAIFLEENFHVEMLTEEDLDYVFEEEFPQWLEEQLTRPERRETMKLVKSIQQPDRKIVRSRQASPSELPQRTDNRFNPFSPVKYAKETDVPIAMGGKSSPEDSIRKSIAAAKKQVATADAVKSDTEGGYTSAPKPTAKPASNARNEVSAKPVASARKSAPKIDYKTPVTRRGPDGTYGLTSKGRSYVARKEAQERKKPFSASKFFSQMQRDGN